MKPYSRLHTALTTSGLLTRRGSMATKTLLSTSSITATSYHHRFIRTKAGAPSADVLRLADRDEPLTLQGRAPPNAISMSYVLDDVADIESYKTEPSVWLPSNTIKESWRALHRSYMSAKQGEEPLRAAQIREKDMVGLALCTAHAEIRHLLSFLPPVLRGAISKHPDFELVDVEEMYLHVGQDVEVRGTTWLIQLPPPSIEDLEYVLKRVGKFGEDGRGCISNTAHRVSVWRGRHGESLGVTIRVGRYVPNAARALLPLAEKGSVLILSRAGMGKTTLLRDLAAALAHGEGQPRVTVVDTSNEIGGDGPIPMPFLGRCRRIQVPRRDEQSRVMVEVIQNHSPEYLVVDELATAAEADAAWSIAQRGVHLIATCHGDSLAGLLQNQALNLLVGGAAQAFLSNEERRLRNKTKKTILERPHASPFQYVVELKARGSGHIYVDVDKAVDLILDDQCAKSDASVGGSASLALPLPARLERLVAELMKRKNDLGRRGDGSSSRMRDDADDGFDDHLDDSFYATRDADGYMVREQRNRPAPYPNRNGFNAKGKGSPKKNRSETLLNELQELL